MFTILNNDFFYEGIARFTQSLIKWLLIIYLLTIIIPYTD